MRKFEKRQIENFILLLEEAHGEIRKLVEKGSREEAADLLVQCQEGAAEAGELIEKTEGGDTAAVSRLEEYCETVYETYEALVQGSEGNANKIYKRLKKSLIQIENSVRNDIKARPEMVFLPYKASMWDSLESVWQAAEADPECDAYVVPIPYYDRRPDGSLGTYHYEGNDLPACVPVINYETYCLEDRNPDAIFIHNPYDHMNHVTSIDPKFYSNESASAGWNALPGSLRLQTEFWNAAQISVLFARLECQDNPQLFLSCPGIPPLSWFPE